MHKLKFYRIDQDVRNDIVRFMVDNNKAKDAADAIGQIDNGFWSVNELMDMYLVWNGIINYTDNIVQAIDTLRAARS